MKKTNRRIASNIQFSKLLGCLVLALFIGAAGLCYVSIKNSQFALGEKVREAERRLRDLRSRTQDLQSRITTLSSRTTLRSRLEGGFIAMTPIPDYAIARLTPPATADEDGVLRTASNQVMRQ